MNHYINLNGLKSVLNKYPLAPCKIKEIRICEMAKNKTQEEYNMAYSFPI